MTDLVKITIDGREHDVPAGELVIKAAQDHGTYIPRFCWHPRMKEVGMCRMCLVEIETPRGTILTTACTTPAASGMVVHTASKTAKKAQEGILEFLLINHPLDCPVCDKGGECPLQDQTVAYGPGESRFVEEKRHFEKPIPISDLVFLDRERCILCARCTRFADEIAGDPLIEFKDRGNYTQVQTFPDLPFSSYFSGNTVQICPVGALTASAYRFKARPWDLRRVESSCSHCTVGCRIAVESSQNDVLRFNGVDNDATNQGWLSDKCRFGFEFVGSENRLRSPLIKVDGEFREATWAEALDVVADRLGAIIEEHGGEAVGGIGGARSTNEEAYAFGKFMRTVVGSNHLDAQLNDGLDARFLAGVSPRAKIGDLDRAATILLWAPDLKEESGSLYLRVRHAVQERGAKLVVVHPRRTGLDDRATHKLTYRPGEGPALLADLAGGEGDYAAVLETLSRGPVVAILGRPGLTEQAELAEAVAGFALGLPDAKVLPFVRRSNVFGALDMGVAPSLLPGRVAVDDAEAMAQLEAVWGPIPTHEARDTLGILEGLALGDLKALVLLGADPVRDVPDGFLARRGIEGADFVVAVDLFLTDSSELADVVLPAEGFGEKEGTVTNLEGRVQKVNRVVAGPGQSQADWTILDDISRRLGKPLGFASAEAISKEIADVAPAYVGVTWELLEWDEKEGAIVPYGEAIQPLTYRLPAVDRKALEAMSRRPSRGAFALHLARTLYDDGVLMRNSLSLQKLAPGGAVHLHPEDAGRLGVTAGALVEVKTVDASVRLPVILDPSLLSGVVYVPFNQPWTPSLGAALSVVIAPGKEVRA
ncbi:MAG: NADH-quinone oxidoreductase subunit NuoG [Acidimicrobiia bacterium]|nr:NADH-quinone oxidoreductase subunit NuoG [Acidimicrobiia bacterium]